MKKILSFFILAFILGFNLWLYYPETKILADPNDNIFQFSLVQRTDWVWRNYGCPLSFSCLPNLVDHVVTVWAEGYPLPFYYSHLPQILMVASYRLFVLPFSSLFSFSFSLYQYYNLTKYLLLCFFPLSVFFALKTLGFDPLSSALAAVFSAHFSTDGLYGIDPPSFLWRGWGLTSQLYALTFMPLATAFIFQALKTANSLPSSLEENGRKNFFSYFLKEKKILGAILFLTLTTAGHLGMGIIAFLSGVPFLFLDRQRKNFFRRLKRLFLIYGATFFLLSYWIVPIFFANQYHLISFWDPIWKFDSYGWSEAVKQLWQGELFDWQRPFPYLTLLIGLGFLVGLSHPQLFPFSFSFLFFFLLYFGRTTWNGLIDLLPGMKDFHQHRFIVGLHLSALFLLPISFSFLFSFSEKISFWTKKILASFSSSKLLWIKKGEKISFLLFLPFLLFSFFLVFAVSQQTVKYAKLNNRWIEEANRAYLYDEKNFQALSSFLQSLPPARVYAGRPGNWGHQFRLGSTQMYMLTAIAGFDTSQFLPETWSMMSDNEQNFDERVKEDYDLLNIRYILAEKNHDFPKEALLLKKFGPFELYAVPTSGWFSLITAPMMVKTEKTNFPNLVYLWHRSYPRQWGMHPLISVGKNPSVPPNLQKIIRLTDEVSYQEETSQEKSLVPKNIFAHFPFVFPEATVSAVLKTEKNQILSQEKGFLAYILEEKVEKQSYSAKISVPTNCPNCYALFKMSYHPNWQVKVDGKKAEKFAVFPFYLATPLTEGTHTIEFTYRPSRLKTFLLAGELITLLVFTFFLFAHRKKIKSSPQQTIPLS